eukprot:g5826.t1
MRFAISKICSHVPLRFSSLTASETSKFNFQISPSSCKLFSSSSLSPEAVSRLGSKKKVSIYACDHHHTKFRTASILMGLQWCFTSNTAAAALNIPGGMESYGLFATSITVIVSTLIALGVPWFAKHTIRKIEILPITTSPELLPRRLRITPYSSFSSGTPFEVALQNAVLVTPPDSTTKGGKNNFVTLKIIGKKAHFLLDKRGDFLSDFSIDSFRYLLPCDHHSTHRKTTDMSNAFPDLQGSSTSQKRKKR